MAKQDLSVLIGKAKETQMSTPVQRIVPIKTKIKETPFNLHFPDDMLKKLKLMSVEEDTSIKNLIISAVREKYFKG